MPLLALLEALMVPRMLTISNLTWALSKNQGRTQPRCMPTSDPSSQELPGDLGRYGRRWIISIPADTCLEGRVGLCPRILVSADDSLFVSEFMTSNTSGDSFSEELWSAGGSLTGTDPTVISSRWIEGWRGCEQQVCSGTAL